MSVRWSSLLLTAARLVRSNWDVFLVCALFKSLLAHSYRSTDFEVHRNWLAVTYRVPVRLWYFEETSAWTLDYPPLFAYAQWALAQLGAGAGLALRLLSGDRGPDGGRDPAQAELLLLSPTPVDTPFVLAFQRASVLLLGDPLLYAGACAYAAASVEAERADGGDDAAGGVGKGEGEGEGKGPGDARVGGGGKSSSGVGRRRRGGTDGAEEDDDGGWRAVLWLVMGSPALVIVDHIHFQYNGALLGLLFATMAFVRARRYAASAAAFTALVLAKHIFLTLAPAVGVWVLGAVAGGRLTTVVSSGKAVQRVARIAAAAVATALVILAPALGLLSPSSSHSSSSSSSSAAAAFSSSTSSIRPGEVVGPLQIAAQMLRRLFPFGRGLVHSYWAPNAWAGYMAADRALGAACKVLAGVRVGKGGGGAALAMLARPFLIACPSSSPHAPVPVPAADAAGDAAGAAGVGAAEGLGLSSSFSPQSHPSPLSTSRLLVLPAPSPLACAVLSLLASAPLLWAVWAAWARVSAHPPSPSRPGLKTGTGTGTGTGTRSGTARSGDARRMGRLLPHVVAAAALPAFLFGWHVHEKAGLVVLLPLILGVGEAITAARKAEAEADAEEEEEEEEEAKAEAHLLSGGGAGALPTTAVGAPGDDGDAAASSARLARLAWRASLPLQACLGPLIFTPLEQPAVAALLVLGPALMWMSLSSFFVVGWAPLTRAEAVYSAALAAAHLVRLVFGPVFFPSLPFFPLLLTSLVCFAGVVAVSIEMLNEVVVCGLGRVAAGAGGGVGGRRGGGSIATAPSGRTGEDVAGAPLQVAAASAVTASVVAESGSGSGADVRRRGGRRGSRAA